MIRVLGIVTARGGSKGIPGKNIIPILGKPLLSYTAETALASKHLNRVILSTDDPDIAEVGRNCGLDVPFLRPLELAQDNTSSLAVLQHVVKKLEESDESYDAIMTLQPTAPLRLSSDIDGAIELMESTGADSIVSLVDTGGVHPFKMKQIDQDGKVIDPEYARGYAHTPRQLLPQFYELEGSIYLTRHELLMNEGKILGDNCLPWIVERNRTVNIDTPEDLLYAEFLISHLQKNT